MTVSSTPAKAGPYTGNDSASAFAFSFKVFAASDIRVVETLIATEAETDLVLNTNYTVVLNNDQDVNPGGTITYKVGGVTTVLPSTKKLTIVGDFTYEQPTDLPDGGAYRASVVENALDRNTMLVKQTQEEVARAVKVPVSSDTDPDQLVADLFAAEANAAASAAAAATSEGNAATSETNAAASASAAAAAAASVLWNDVVFKTFADSPITLTSADSGKLFAVDATGGNVVINLPEISNLTLPWTLGVKKTDASANTVTVNRAGTDTIDGGTSKAISSADSGATFIPDADTSPDEWTTADFGATVGQTKRQQFSAGSDFTAGSTTTLTITETPIPSTKDCLDIHFDAAYQQEDTWSYNAGTGVVTFSSAIPLGTLKVEAKWDTPLGIGTPADGSVTPAKIAAGYVISGFKNKLINSNFQINQRAVSGSVVLAAGVYGHDRWKAGASGCSYTFASSNGKTTLTISAGSLQQVIASENVPVGTNTCVLSWEGTAQGKIGAGSYAASGVTGSVTGGSNLTIEFGTGTLAVPQFELGSYATVYEQKTYETEYENCLFYFERIGNGGTNQIIGMGLARSATDFRVHMTFQQKRSVPGISVPATPTAAVGNGTFTGTTVAGVITNNTSFVVMTTSGMTIGWAGYLYAVPGEYWLINAEL